MSGSQFLETLRRVGVPNVDRVDGPSIDWLFDNEAAVPFLEWFCSELNSSNKLTRQEIEEFQRIEASEGILEGYQLDDILHGQVTFSEEELTTEQLREEVQKLEDEVKSGNMRKEALIQQRNKLSMHHTGLMDKVSKLDTVHNAAKLSYKQSLEESHADNNKINQGLCELSSAVGDLDALYRRVSPWRPEEMKEPEPATFLSQLDLQKYFKAEIGYTTQLSAYTKNQFFHGIAEMAGESEGSRYEFLEISNPDTLLVKGESADVIKEDCKELTRLQQYYPVSEKRRINALLEEKTMETACDCTEEKLRTLKSNAHADDVATLSKKEKSAENVLTGLRRDVARCLESEIPNLIQDNAVIQVTKILNGDYELKITRQNYFTSNQDKLINWLIKQRARKEFLTMSYELEAKYHREVRRLLAAIALTLQDNKRAYQRRMEVMTDPTTQGRSQHRSTVDSRDKTATSLHKMLEKGGGSGKPQLFITYSELEEDADRLHHEVTSLRGTLAARSSSQDDNIPLLERQLASCHSFVYSGTATVGGAPALSPAPVVDGLSQLESVLQRLEEAVVDLMKDTEHKKKLLREDSLSGKERELFVHFFTDPARLRQTQNDVQCRLEAQLIK